MKEYGWRKTADESNIAESGLPILWVAKSALAVSSLPVVLQALRISNITLSPTLKLRL